MQQIPDAGAAVAPPRHPAGLRPAPSHVIEGTGPTRGCSQPAHGAGHPSSHRPARRGCPAGSIPPSSSRRHGQSSYTINYSGAWGDPAQLGRFLQAYALEKASLGARAKGHSVSERALADGSVKLTVTVGGGA